MKTKNNKQQKINEKQKNILDIKNMNNKRKIMNTK